MNLDLDFVYYRNLRFDGKFHVRCSGGDLDKVARIRYELERIEPGGPVHLTGESSVSMAFSGALVDHGCPATLFTTARPGTYRISPRVILLDAQALAHGLPPGARGVIDLEPLTLVLTEQDLTRSIVDAVPLRRRRRALVEPAAAPSLDEPFAQLGYDDASEAGSEVLPMGARPNVQGALLLLDQLLGSGRFLSAHDEL